MFVKCAVGCSFTAFGSDLSAGFCADTSSIQESRESRSHLLLRLINPLPAARARPQLRPPPVLWAPALLVSSDVTAALFGCLCWVLLARPTTDAECPKTLGPEPAGSPPTPDADDTQTASLVLISPQNIQEVVDALQT